MKDKIENLKYNLENNFEVSAFAICSFDKKELVQIANYFRNIGYRCEIKKVNYTISDFILTIYR